MGKRLDAVLERQATAPKTKEQQQAETRARLLAMADEDLANLDAVLADSEALTATFGDPYAKFA